MRSPVIVPDPTVQPRKWKYDPVVPHCQAAIRYHLPIAERSKRASGHMHDKIVEGQASITASQADVLMGSNQQAFAKAGAPGRPGTPAQQGSASQQSVPGSAQGSGNAAPDTETPEQKLAREEEENRRKLEEEKEKERKRELAKNDPCNKKRRWLAVVPNLLESVKQQAKNAKEADRMNNQVSETYHTDLSGYEKKLATTRTKL